MKFEYDVKAEEKSVAVLHKSGCLIIQTEDGCVVFDAKSAAIHNGKKASFWEGTATHKFYPGDKITITF